MMTTGDGGGGDDGGGDDDRGMKVMKRRMWLRNGGWLGSQLVCRGVNYRVLREAGTDLGGVSVADEAVAPDEEPT